MRQYPKFTVGQLILDSWSKRTGVIKNIEYAPDEKIFAYDIQVPVGDLSTTEDCIILIDNDNLTDKQKEELIKQHNENIQNRLTTSKALEFQNESEEFRTKFCYYCECLNGCNLCQKIKNKAK